MSQITISREATAPVALWTNTRPSLPGLYWLSYEEEVRRPEVVLVEEHGELCVRHFHEDDDGPQPLDADTFEGALWSGPLEPPA